MGATGALMSSPDAIAKWPAEFRLRSLGPFQLNLWIAEPAAPARDFAAEQRVREFLSSWAPAVPKAVRLFDRHQTHSCFFDHGSVLFAICR